MDVVEGMLKNAEEPAWLEQYVFGDFRVWQIIFMALAGFIALIIALCCCIRFRVPRTKQQIEADYQRRIITNKFRQQLERIQNSQMDTIDLKAALDLVRAEFKADTDSEKDLQQEQSASLMSSIVSPVPSSDDVSLRSSKNFNGKQLPEPQMDKKCETHSLSNKIAALVKISKQKTNKSSQAMC